MVHMLSYDSWQAALFRNILTLSGLAKLFNYS